MFSVDDIFTRLQAGESLDSIVSEVTTNINRANTKYKEFKTNEAARIRIKEAQRTEELKAWFMPFREYIRKYHSDIYDTCELEDVSLTEFDTIFTEFLNGFQKETNALKELLSEFSLDSDSDSDSDEPEQRPATKSQATDEVLDEFLKSLGI